MFYTVLLTFDVLFWTLGSTWEVVKLTAEDKCCKGKRQCPALPLWATLGFQNCCLFKGTTLRNKSQRRFRKYAFLGQFLHEKHHCFVTRHGTRICRERARYHCNAKFRRRTWKMWLASSMQKLLNVWFMSWLFGYKHNAMFGYKHNALFCWWQNLYLGDLWMSNIYIYIIYIILYKSLGEDRVRQQGCESDNTNARVRQHESDNTDARVRQQKRASQTTDTPESDNRNVRIWQQRTTKEMDSHQPNANNNKKRTRN